ncbi:hypothetical protein ANN_18624 [Periplaneta americana]|uniref:Uncharacterized protein n=1 Tax=Periplaneta americana TaxID=6978 RepID=A0ABQ8SP96_PERAM|nr:hypothetical protein ANN_18624 [Periplaneta americana]
MAGLCQGGNEPSGSLKAICKDSCFRDAAGRLRSLDVEKAAMRVAASSRHRFPEMSGRGKRKSRDRDTRRFMEFLHLASILRITKLLYKALQEYALLLRDFSFI